MQLIAHETDVAKLTPHGWREHFQAEVAAQRDAALTYFAGRQARGPAGWASRDSYG